MAKVISFEKFEVLKAAGLNEREAKGVHHAPQLHSASENYVQTVTRHASPGAKRGW